MQNILPCFLFLFLFSCSKNPFGRDNPELNNSISMQENFIIDFYHFYSDGEFIDKGYSIYFSNVKDFNSALNVLADLNSTAFSPVFLRSETFYHYRFHPCGADIMLQFESIPFYLD